LILFNACLPAANKIILDPTMAGLLAITSLLDWPALRARAFFVAQTFVEIVRN